MLEPKRRAGCDGAHGRACGRGCLVPRLTLVCTTPWQLVVPCPVLVPVLPITLAVVLL